MVEEKRLIREIISLILFLVIIVPICVNASNDYNNRVKSLENDDKVLVDISTNNDKSSDEIISNKVVTLSNANGGSIRVNLIFKIVKFTNSYTLFLGDNSYNLDELEYSEDQKYLYYNLGEFVVDGECRLNFKLVLNNDISYDSSVSYSFIVEGV